MIEGLIPIKYQAIIFANNKEITTDPLIIQKLYNDLAKYQVIPAPFNEIDTNNQIINRLKFYRIDNSLSISFGMNQLSIEASAIQSRPLDNIADFIASVTDIVSIIDVSYPKIANRISIVSTYKSSTLTDAEKNSIYNRIYDKIKIYDSISPAEWTHRACYRFHRNINGKNEMLNNIFTIIKGGVQQTFPSGIITRFNDLDLVIDFNTIPENTDFRLSINDFLSFYKESLTWNNAMINKIKEIIFS